MEGDKKKAVSWKCEEAGGAGGGDEVLEYELEEGNTTRRKVEEIPMMLAKRKLKREEKKRLEHIQAQYQEKEDKLKEWRQTIPENKRIVTDDVFLGVPSIHHFPLFLDKEQKERIERAKEKGRHTFGSPNLLFIQSKGRFVSYLTMEEGKTTMRKVEESEMKMGKGKLQREQDKRTCRRYRNRQTSWKNGRRLFLRINR